MGRLRLYRIDMKYVRDLAKVDAHADEIARKAARLYRIVTEQPERYRVLVRRCCDFKRLEAVLEVRAQHSGA